MLGFLIYFEELDAEVLNYQGAMSSKIQSMHVSVKFFFSGRDSLI